MYLLTICQQISKTQISKIIQSGGSFGSWFGNLRKKPLTNIAIPLASSPVVEIKEVPQLGKN